MQLPVSLGLLTVLISSVTARYYDWGEYHPKAYCTAHIYYCGKTLLTVGNYRDQIKDVLRSEGYPLDDWHINNVLLYCRKGTSDELGFERMPKYQCYDGGDGRSDYVDDVGPVSPYSSSNGKASVQVEQTVIDVVN
ncbi:hypothetical protein F9C07_2282471 [Aspergillus flavus]|uniref:Uncharacterized protein n=4 Tax=Aspergillus subgen. Circumdati TaxID=2720871 RepID=A0A7U2MNI5_ASPFN|nr:unnamed protein product [Aspergillus oryzae RIB40]EIT78110.1 hypothetical protein Ao3042_05776 [Aspergillus oryzae 3.042]KDE79575.1 hypothetical protein AO1008_06075 [Aspergillus oryzae 100-8]KOC13142.1 hypothetical protein AFLA70_16g005261 [Aspergillus flavus AF70]QRD86555.1 hypothetical protein F9C07_2282471 [Aspergillus flavus]BAE59863.1 unnamed protein product [Aspergillus oryzae RIB40]|eukprot:EIT78110.1 hypothetical protein Ao3042_05776 [Aspergillus oryzae 3.042]